MRVENIHYNIPNMKSVAGVPSKKVSASSDPFETSIYNQKAVTLPFGCWAKGANAAEEVCIKTFRKVRQNRCRKYTEPQIIGFMRELHQIPEGQNINTVVDELFTTYKVCLEEFGAPLTLKPDADFVTNYLKVAKNCDEYERLGLIGFTQHELCQGAVKPLEALANATPEQQSRFIKLMNDISFNATERSQDLYDDLRHVIYAAEDLPKLNDSEKLQYLSDVHIDYNRLKSDNSFGSKTEKENVLKISREIVETMMDVLKI